MLYSIDGKVVFGKAVTIPVEGDHAFLDIFGDPVPMDKIMAENDAKINRERRVVDTASQINLNTELGPRIVALWREYVIRTGIHGQGRAQIATMSMVFLELFGGCLFEAAESILELAEDSIVTPEIKAKFSAACTAADHII